MLTHRKNDDKEDEFLISRILFLLTYGTNVNFGILIDEQQLAESINQVNLAFTSFWHAYRM